MATLYFKVLVLIGLWLWLGLVTCNYAQFIVITIVTNYIVNLQQGHCKIKHKCNTKILTVKLFH